jgi:hypothetical protein
VQGAYLVKAFAKHGALHNPHAYGFFDHAPHKNFRGGHVTVGGIVYQGDSFPESFRGKYIAGDLLGHGVYWHDIEPRGSTFQTAHGGELLVANDTWFASTDVTMGPDGAIYVSDWHDSRTAHPDPDAEWDRTNGRIYRIAAKGTKPAASFDFARLSNDELLTLHSHRSQWYVRHARQELARRAAHQPEAPARANDSQPSDSANPRQQERPPSLALRVRVSGLSLDASQPVGQDEQDGKDRPHEQDDLEEQPSGSIHNPFGQLKSAGAVNQADRQCQRQQIPQHVLSGEQHDESRVQS